MADRRTSKRRERGSPPPPSARPSKPWPGRTSTLAAIAAAACLVRLLSLRLDLPDFTEEALPFRKALAMWRPDGSVDWNPHFFHHPSLTLYLHLALQKLQAAIGTMVGTYVVPADYLVSFRIDPTPMAMLARLLGIAAAAVTVFYVGRIGERLRPGAGIVAALIAFMAPSLLGVSQSIFSDSVMVALMLVAFERMLAYREHGGRHRWIASVILIGLATGAKYPAAVLLLPLALVSWERGRTRGLAWWALGCLGAALVFLATTPYALLDAMTFARDFAFVGRLGVEGHLGNIGRSAALYHAGNLVRDLGWPGVAALAASLVLTLVHWRDRGAAIAAWVLLVALWLPISLAHVVAERYIVPVTVIAAPLACAAALELLDRVPAARRRVAVAVASVLLVASPIVTGIGFARPSGPSTHVEARRWCEIHLTHADLLVQELYGAHLNTRLEAASFMAGPTYQLASPAMQQRFASLPWFSSVSIPLSVVGRLAARIPTDDGAHVDIDVFDHPADLNQVFYDPRLYHGVDVVLTSSAVRSRFQADPIRYAVENRFYALLDTTAEEMVHIRPQAATDGPEISIYRLGAATRAALAAMGPLDPLWWTTYVPDSYRERAQAAMSPPLGADDHGLAIELGPGQAPPDGLGHPPAWVMSLSDMFEQRIASFARSMSLEHFEHGRVEIAQRYAAAMLAARPQDVGSCLLYVNCARALEAWSDARDALDAGIAATIGEQESQGWLRLELADLLAHDGEVDHARTELQWVASLPDAYLASEARQRLDALP